MAENSKISWTTHTFNPWMGCTKISSGCANCYAATLTKNRMGLDLWGQSSARQVTKQPWKDVLRWNKKAEESGVQTFVFCASLCDIFEDHPTAIATLPRVWDVIRQCKSLTFQLLTKRADRIKLSLPPDWGTGWDNVWLGTSVENHAAADQRIPYLLQCPAAVRFLSVEPMLGAVDVQKWIGSGGSPPKAAGINSRLHTPTKPTISLIICGGESGPGARTMNLDLARSLRDQCVAAGVPFFFKQESGTRPGTNPTLDGKEWHQFPTIGDKL